MITINQSDRVLISRLIVASIIVLCIDTIFFMPVEEPRTLRFFDPQHSICGDDQEHHDYGIHSLYGTVDKAYYLNLTVTTDEDLDASNHTEVDKVLQTLIYVAAKTNRFVLPKIPLIDEDSHRGSELLQAWSVVDAGYVKSMGTKAVEYNYWARAGGARGHTPRRLNATLGDDPKTALETIIEKLKKSTNATDEVVFNKTELLLVDSDEIGRLAGESGGYVNGKWKRPFTCIKEVRRVTTVPL